MILTEQQIFDYIHCPTKYHIKYHKKFEVQDPISLPRLLSKVSKYFYFNLFNGKVCSINELKSKWDSICKQYPHFVDSKKNLAGWGLIINLVQWAGKEEIIVADVDQQYKLLIDSDEVVGSIETILIRRDKKIELLQTNFNDREPDQHEIDTKLKYTLDFAAFKAMHGRYPNGIRAHSIKTNRDFYTYRTEPDINRLITTIKGVSKGIQNRVFYPRESPMCYTCTAREYCRYWDGKE